MGHERAQAGAEGDGGHHHRDGEDGAEDGRTDRDGAAAGAGLEGEADTRPQPQAAGPHGLLPWSTRDDGTRGWRPRPAPGRARSDATTATRPIVTTSAGAPSPSTVQSGCTSRARYGRTGPSGASGDERERHEHGTRAPDDDGSEGAEEPVRQRHGRVRPEGPDDVELVGLEADATADDLPTDEEHGHAGDPAEDPERNGLGPQRGIGGGDVVA